MLAATAGVLVVVIAASLIYCTESKVPWWDATPSALSLIAQWMISKKKIENWLVWILVDLISIPLFAYKGLYLTSSVYAVFLILCLFGLIAWRKTYRSSAAA
jgi:nicotinamide mononucleotide transporter